MTLCEYIKGGSSIDHKLTTPKLFSRKTIIGYGILIILTGIVFYRNYDFFNKVYLEIKEINLSNFLIISILAIVYRILDGTFLYLLGKRHAHNFHLYDGIRIAFCGSFFRVAALGNGMGIAKAYYLTQNDISIEYSVGICLVQNFFYKISVLIIGCTAFLLNSDIWRHFSLYHKAFIIGILLNLVIVLFLFIISTCHSLTNKLFYYAYKFTRKSKQITSKLHRLEEQVLISQSESKLILKNRHLTINLLLFSIMWQATLYSIIYFSLNKTVSFKTSFSIMGIVIMLAGVIPLPSGFGSLEVVFTMLFSKICESHVAASAILLFRFVSTFVPFFIGIIPVFQTYISKNTSTKYS